MRYVIAYAAIFLIIRAVVYVMEWNEETETKTGKLMLVTDLLTLFWPVFLIIIPASYVVHRCENARWAKNYAKNCAKWDKHDAKNSAKKNFLKTLYRLDIIPLVGIVEMIKLIDDPRRVQVQRPYLPGRI